MKTLYTSHQVKQVDILAAQYLKISSFELMKQAGKAFFNYVQHFNSTLVVTGAGNNAGDGFICADLLMQSGKNVMVWNLVPIEKLPTDAYQAAQNYLKNGGTVINQKPQGVFDCIVDALFGTGLCRDIEGVFAETVNWINSQNSPVVAVDIPSGLHADTGAICGCAVNADITVSIICYKAGQVTNYGKQQCGELSLEDLGIPYSFIQEVPSQLKLLDQSVLSNSQFNHKHNSHKGSFGQTVIVGGHDGMLGALLLAGKAALQSGCGLVEVVSNNKQAVMISIHCPELITAQDIKASRLLKNADVIAIGPGLGLNQQSKHVLEHCLSHKKPMVIDADALTLVAGNYNFNHDVIITPHPKEAATLLATDVDSIQADRVKAAKELSKKYNAVTILKGSGTIVANPNGTCYICPFGYSGMATAGMGDVLTGMVASLLAQGFSAIKAAKTAVVWHALAAENCNKGNCLIATDVINQLAYEI